MDDLIRRSDALAAFAESTSAMPKKQGRRRIEEIPAVDAVEVKHGRWEGNYPRAMFRLKRCSVCETLAPEGWYCFFCGAEMDG